MGKGASYVTATRKLRWGMVGGGLSGSIGWAHRICARQHGLFELVAGAFSSNVAMANASAATYKVAADRSYASFAQMANAEAARDDGIEAVTICTPHDLHVEPAIAFAQAGIDVICEKPVADTFARALELEQAICATDVEFIVTHNYTGYPLVRQARQMVATGAIGELRQVRSEYLQDGRLSKSRTDLGWRADSQRCGDAGSMADIGSHAYHMLRFVTGKEVHSVAADFATYSEMDQEDHAEVLLRYAHGARGSMTCSQSMLGRKCDLRFDIYGEQGSLHWGQENPNEMLYCRLDEPKQILQRGMSYLGEYGTPASNIAPGHTEGYYEAFAQIYLDAHALITARRYGDDPGNARELVPNLADAIAVERFIYATVQSAASDARWVELDGLVS